MKLSKLAQSFFIDVDKFPNGVHVHSVNLYFRRVDRFSTVTVTLKPMKNGFPDNTAEYPFGTSTIMGDQIVSYGDGYTPTLDDPTATYFVFNAPVYLKPGEHCFALQSNSNEFEVFTAKLGEKLLADNTTILSNNPYDLGVLFKSSNGFTYTPDQNEDIMFSLNVCDFVLNSPGVISFNTNKITDVPIYTEYNLYKLTTNEMVLNNTSITHYIQTMNDDLTKDPYNNTPADVDVLLQTPKYVRYNFDNVINTVSSLVTTDRWISPMVEQNRHGIMTVKNLINAGGISGQNFKVTNAGSNYGPTTTITTPGSPSGTAIFHPIVIGGKIAGLVFTSSGSGYTPNAEYDVTVSLSSGTPSVAAVVKALTDDVGAMVSYRIVNEGAGYGPLISVSPPNLGGSQAYPELIVGGLTLASARTITGVRVPEAYAGSGYTISPTITLSNPGGLPGSGMAVTCSLENGTTGGNCQAKYVHKTVELTYDSSHLNVFLDVNRPQETNIDVFAKFLNYNDPTNIKESEWIQMNLPDGVTQVPVATDNTFAEVNYSLENVSYEKTVDSVLTNFVGFNKFKVKIVMMTTNNCVVPRIKNFRAIATK